MADLGVWTVEGDAPQSVQRGARVDFEKHLEGWIANDPTLLAGGLTIVGRQVRLDGGALDLLAIDLQDRWVVIELKRGRLYRDALAQAFDYASSIAQVDGEDLANLLQSGLGALGDVEELSRAVRRQLDSEEAGREVAVLLAGVGVDAGLERIVEYMGRFGIPISVVSFEVFEPEGGPRLLIREVIEEQAEPQPQPRPRRTVGAIRQRAEEAGVVAQFDRFVGISEEAGLAVQPYKHAVRIAPSSDRRWYLMYARPENSGIVISAGPREFATFFPPLTEAEATEAIGPSDGGRHFTGVELDARLEQIEAFLKTLPRPDDDGDSE